MMRSSRSRKTVAIAVAAIRLCRSLLACASSIDLALQLVVDGRQLLVDRLQFLAAGLQFLGRRAQLLVHRLQLFVAGLQLLGRAFVLLHGVAQLRLQPLELALELRAADVGRSRRRFRPASPRSARPARTRRRRRNTSGAMSPAGATRTSTDARSAVQFDRHRRDDSLRVLRLRGAVQRRPQLDAQHRMHGAQQIRWSARRRQSCRKRPALPERCRISCSPLTSDRRRRQCRSSSLQCSSPHEIVRRRLPAARRARQLGRSVSRPRRPSLRAGLLARAASTRASALAPGRHRQPGRVRRPLRRRSGASCRAASNSRASSSTASEAPRNSRPSRTQRESGRCRSDGCCASRVQVDQQVAAEMRSSRENGESFSRSCSANSTVSRSSRRTR